jgi:hypothetical protein
MTWKLPMPVAAPQRPQEPPAAQEEASRACGPPPMVPMVPIVEQPSPDAEPPRPLRLSWRDFPPEYIDALRTAATVEGRTARLGPMSWNDARFSQREFYRLVATLRRNVTEGDQEALALDNIARQLRVSVPRCEHDLKQHWFILKANPLVKAVREQER